MTLLELQKFVMQRASEVTDEPVAFADHCIWFGNSACINEDGCTWDCGVGNNPNGVFCGECTNIDKRYCSARKYTK